MIRVDDESLKSNPSWLVIAISIFLMIVLLVSPVVRVYGAEAVSNSIENSDSAWKFLGSSWTFYNHPSNSSGSAMYTNVAGSYAEVSFSGSAFKLLGIKSPYYGIGSVFLDGQKVGEIDYYAASLSFQQMLYQVSGLEDGAHTLRIELAGSKNPSSQGTYISVDRLDVTSSAEPVTDEPSSDDLFKIYANVFIGLALGYGGIRGLLDPWRA